VISPTTLRSAPQRRARLEVAGDREAQALASHLGREIRAARHRLGMTQAQLAARAGIRQSWLGEIERGGGRGVPLGVWVALGLVIGRPVAVGFSRETSAATRDAGHLAIQELVLRLARGHTVARAFELATPSLGSIDCVLRDERRRILILIEIWNRLDDVGAARRATNRKADELRGLEVAWHEPAAIRVCWVVRATAANRALVARYPNVFETAFPGSSRDWTRALTAGVTPPEKPGLVWSDLGATRLFEWRRRSS